ncbi:MAG: arsenosugar biosynthesis radical SAM protein ArsS [Flavobacteriales bacterium]|nr:arsenosugar biosynthesis radical SAM protein ArsS [Flavobacteriales bacterium]MCB9447159.1 arsenosugar biosynthesis radical SAM protein ArsS [Flavobacteriales bacterium]
MKSLKAQGHPLSDAAAQLEWLHADDKVRFDEKLRQCGQMPLRPSGIDILQVNVGKMCNQTCRHCHVDAGPDRKEVMTRDTMEQCLDVLSRHNIGTVDITGGAPEMNPHFRWFVEEVSKMGKHIINRCNLTILLAHPRFADLPTFFARHRVEVVSSLPHYTPVRTDRQRGEGVFEKSVKALQMLNEAGYGQPGSGLELNLVYNPTGALLAGPQESLEADYKRELHERHGIVFNRLFVITNMPVSRFLDYLITSGNYDTYMQKLVDAFNPGAAANVMCRNTLSVGWDGFLYDCDFNQMLDIKVQCGADHISQFNAGELAAREIAVDRHCFGCTAGLGSSCGGQTAT